LIAYTGTTLFVAVKGQKLAVPHCFKMESNGPGKLRKLIVDIRYFRFVDLTRTFLVVEEVLADSSSQQCSHQAFSL